MDRIIMTTGRWCVWLAYGFPLSTRFLDEDFRDDEARHIRWGVGFYVGLMTIVAIAFVGWKTVPGIP